MKGYGGGSIHGEQNRRVRASFEEMGVCQHRLRVTVADSFIWASCGKEVIPFRRRRQRYHRNEFVPLAPVSLVAQSGNKTANVMNLMVDCDDVYFVGSTIGIGCCIICWLCPDSVWHTPSQLTVNINDTLWNAVYEYRRLEIDAVLLDCLDGIWGLVCLVQRYLVLGHLPSSVPWLIK